MRDAVIQRAGGRCEAQVSVRDVWTRCFASPVEVHHMLFRSRGGSILDSAGEIAHLAALCPAHHRVAHLYSEGSDFVIEGYVTTGTNNQPVYIGPDPYLTEKYPNHAEKDRL